MEFEWDDAKSEANERLRGIGFGRAAMIFNGPTVEAVDNRYDYGERRVKAIGKASNQIYVVIYTDRDAVRRIISARRASRKERKQWQSFVNP